MVDEEIYLKISNIEKGNTVIELIERNDEHSKKTEVWKRK